MDNGNEYIICHHCGYGFYIPEDDYFWDSSNYTLVKACKCKRCNETIPLEYIEDDNINFDLRYYTYKN